MKKLIFIIGLTLLLFSCSEQGSKKTQNSNNTNSSNDQGHLMENALSNKTWLTSSGGGLRFGNPGANGIPVTYIVSTKMDAEIYATATINEKDNSITFHYNGASNDVPAAIEMAKHTQKGNSMVKLVWKNSEHTAFQLDRTGEQFTFAFLVSYSKTYHQL